MRIAARLAARRLPLACGLRGNPKLHRLPENQRRAILRALRLAQELGAETATLADPSEERAVLRYAREHNLGKIIIGRRSSAGSCAAASPIASAGWARISIW